VDSSATSMQCDVLADWSKLTSLQLVGAGMREQLRELNGKLEIESHARGTSTASNRSAQLDPFRWKLTGICASAAA